MAPQGWHGWLLKGGSTLTPWKKRFFVLGPNRFSYFADQSCEHEEDTLELLNIKYFCYFEDDHGSFAICDKSNHIWTLRFTSPVQPQSCGAALARHVKRCSVVAKDWMCRVGTLHRRRYVVLLSSGVLISFADDSYARVKRQMLVSSLKSVGGWFEPGMAGKRSHFTLRLSPQGSRGGSGGGKQTMLHILPKLSSSSSSGGSSGGSGSGGGGDTGYEEALLERGTTWLRVLRDRVSPPPGSGGGDSGDGGGSGDGGSGGGGSGGGGGGGEAHEEQGGGSGGGGSSNGSSSGSDARLLPSSLAEAVCLRQLSSAQTQQLRERVRAGVPPEERGPVWVGLCGARRKQGSISDPSYAYASMLPHALQSLSLQHRMELESDLATIPCNQQRIDRLRRLVAALATRSSCFGYCPVLLPLMNLLCDHIPNEEMVFWVCAVVAEDILPGFFHGSGLHAHVEGRLLAILLSRLCPDLLAHLLSLPGLLLDLPQLQLPAAPTDADGDPSSPRSPVPVTRVRRSLGSVSFASDVPPNETPLAAPAAAAAAANVDDAVAAAAEAAASTFLEEGGEEGEAAAAAEGAVVGDDVAATAGTSPVAPATAATAGAGAVDGGGQGQGEAGADSDQPLHPAPAAAVAATASAAAVAAIVEPATASAAAVTTQDLSAQPLSPPPANTAVAAASASPSPSPSSAATATATAPAVAAAPFTLSQLCTSVMLSLLTSLPPPVASRVWDIVFVDGIVAVHRIALALFNTARPRLLRCATASDVTDVLTQLLFGAASGAAAAAAAAAVGTHPYSTGLLVVSKSLRFVGAGVFSRDKLSKDRIEERERVLSLASPLRDWLRRRRSHVRAIGRSAHKYAAEIEAMTAAIALCFPPPTATDAATDDAAAVPAAASPPSDAHALGAGLRALCLRLAACVACLQATTARVQARQSVALVKLRVVMEQARRIPRRGPKADPHSDYAAALAQPSTAPPATHAQRTAASAAAASASPSSSAHPDPSLPPAAAATSGWVPTRLHLSTADGVHGASHTLRAHRVSKLPPPLPLPLSLLRQRQRWHGARTPSFAHTREASLAQQQTQTQTQPTGAAVAASPSASPPASAGGGDGWLPCVCEWEWVEHCALMAVGEQFTQLMASAWAASGVAWECTALLHRVNYCSQSWVSQPLPLLAFPLEHERAQGKRSRTRARTHSSADSGAAPGSTSSTPPVVSAVAPAAAATASGSGPAHASADAPTRPRTRRFRYWQQRSPHPAEGGQSGPNGDNCRGSADEDTKDDPTLSAASATAGVSDEVAASVSGKGSGGAEPESARLTTTAAAAGDPSLPQSVASVVGEGALPESYGQRVDCSAIVDALASGPLLLPERTLAHCLFTLLPMLERFLRLAHGCSPWSDPSPVPHCHPTPSARHDSSHPLLPTGASRELASLGDSLARLRLESSQLSTDVQVLAESHR